MSGAYFGYRVIMWVINEWRIKQNHYTVMTTIAEYEIFCINTITERGVNIELS